MRISAFFLSCWLLLGSVGVFAADDKILLLTIKGPIVPATQDYIERGLHKAADEHFAAVLLKLNTPGGLESSMRGINEAIINSPVPVITYVAPAGARAASAGVYLLYASHLAYMAPASNVGAASPVALGGNTAAADAKNQSAQEKKSVNDAVAYLKSLAQMRGKNAEWAESAVRQAASIPAEEAKNLHVIDDVADNDAQVLEKANGKKVTVLGKEKIIDTKEAQIETLTPDWRHQFLSFLTNPNVAYILLLIAIYGIFFEFANPGMVLPGVAGIIALLLVLYAFQLMPINYIGLSLVVLGIAFMIAEVYIASFGAIGAGGIIAFIIGSIMLFDDQNPYYQLTWSIILSMSLISFVFFFMIATLAIQSHKRAVITGKEGLLGAEGVVLSVMNEQVIVRVLGEIWEARAPVMLERGQRVKVVQINGLILTVQPLQQSET